MNDERRTKVDLIKELKLYKGLLSDSALKYLNSLVESEFSVIRQNKNIEGVQRRLLSEIDIYRDIAIYNIRERAEGIFNAQKDCNEFRGDKDYRYISLSVDDFYNTRKELPLFWLYGRDDALEEVPEGYKTSQIGKLRLYKTIWSDEKRILEIKRLVKVLNKLRVEYKSSNDDFRKKYVLPEYIGKYESILAELKSRHEPNLNQEKAIEQSSRIYNLFMDDYGLSSSDFKEKEEKERVRLLGDEFMQKYRQESEMKKVFVKKLPNLTIESHITYL